MKTNRFFLFSIVLHIIVGLLQGDLIQPLDTAENLFKATLFNKAIPVYTEILKATEENQAQQEFIKYRLGQSHYYLNEFEEAHAYFNSINYTLLKSSLEEPNLLADHLPAITCRQLKKYQKAIEILSEQEPLTHQAHFELALNYFLSENHFSAKNALKELEKKCKNEPLHTLVQFYLSRISIIHGCYSEASEHLNNLKIPTNDPLLLELAYLHGEIAFHTHCYESAIQHFTQALPKRNFEHAAWTCDTLYYLGWSHLKIADDQSQSLNLETAVQDDKVMQDFELELLLMGGDHSQKVKAPPFRSDYGSKDCVNLSSSTAISRLNDQKFHFDKAVEAFSQLRQIKPTEKTHLALAQCYLAKGVRFNEKQMFSLAEEILSDSQNFTTPEAQSHALLLITEMLVGDARLNLEATYHFKKNNFKRAEEFFNCLVAEYPHSQWLDEALYWSAICAEKLKREDRVIKETRKKLFEEYSTSPLAASAYFQYYSYREYLQSDRNAIKHLKAFNTKFPDSPLLINAHHLIGLDYKRDRKSSNEKFLSKKNLTKAIATFSKTEQLFDTFYDRNLIPQDQLEHYITIRYRAMLERAMANQAIAESSQGAKREIYFQYAQKLFIQINQEFSKGSSLAIYLTHAQPFPKIQEECLYRLIQSYIKVQNDADAERYIDFMIAKYTELNISKSYYLSRIYYEKGMIAMEQSQYNRAWSSFMLAEKHGGENLLSTDQKLDLWIQESECCKAQNLTDKAMMILSKVINDNTISSLRVKAMYLRASIYAMQGRHDLARKQLAATATKGGEWALKAKLKLEEDYGLQ